MIRLHVIAEGHTELNFAKQVLAPHLGVRGISVYSRCVLISKDNRLSKEYRGGLPNYEKAKRDILAWMKQGHQPECRFTTMFDLYALPDDFPGYDEAMKIQDKYARVHFLEEKMADDIGDRRFIPYIQLHEFEALILANPQQLAETYLGREAPVQRLAAMTRDQNPELINDGPETAPSKRILKVLPEYDKKTEGAAIAGQIGLPVLREKCRHFAAWLSTLERLDGGTP